MVNILFINNISAQNKTNNDSVSDCFVQKKIRQLEISLYSDLYPFVKYNKNCIEFVEHETFQQFLMKLTNQNKGKITILHIGDSHIHADIFTGYVRNCLQSLYGNGGRGLVFPYKAAGTHATVDYTTQVTGNWLSAKITEKNPAYHIGISGVSVHTNDVYATASIIFKPELTSITKDTLRISVFYKPSEHAFPLQISSGNAVWQLEKSSRFSGVQYGKLKCETDTIHISFVQSDTLQNFFELYGIVLENNEIDGIVYHNAGLNGASLQHIQNQLLFEKHLQILQPDLIIIDLGTNDIISGVFDEFSLRLIITTAIKRMQNIIPNVPIILFSPQEMYNRRKHISSPEKFSTLLRTIAIENECMLYDFYQISGGAFAMPMWEKNGLARRDRVHLTKKGYELKGQLFANALLQEIFVNQYQSNSNTKNCLHDTCLKYLFSDTLMHEKFLKKQIIDDNNNQSETSILHVVKSGESLSSIASKYKVSVENIKQWNKISGSIIYTDQKLVIHQKISLIDNNITNDQPTCIVHTVIKGNSLSEIARMYSVSVQKIKEWNNLDTDMLKIGTELKIYR